MKIQMGKLKDRTGLRYGRLTVVSRDANEGSRACWLCQCDCGQATVVRGNNLEMGRTRSCGCLQDELCAELGRKHGPINGHRNGRKSFGPAHGAWKEDPTYSAIHAWVLYHKTKTGICIDCGADVGTAKGSGTEWSNIDHQYSRNLDDYVERCRSCHKKYDGGMS